MSNYYIGGIGKDYKWKLVSEYPFMVYDQEANTFASHGKLSEVVEYIDSSLHNVYAFSSWTANWEEVHFSSGSSGTEKKALGFEP